MENQHHSEPVHTYGCALPTRGGACDCGLEEAIGSGLLFRQRFVVGVDPAGPFAAEIGRAMSRGFDYTALAGGFDEGIHDDEEEQ